MWLALKLDVIKATSIDLDLCYKVPSLGMFCRIAESLYSFPGFSTVTVWDDFICFTYLQRGSVKKINK